GTDYSNGAADCGANMSDNAVRPGEGHVLGFLSRGNIQRREEVHLAGECDHLDFLLHAHTSHFEYLTKVAINNCVGWEVVYSRKSHVLNLAEPMPHAATWITGMDPTKHRNFSHYRENFVFPDLHGYFVGIAVSHQTASAPMTGHPETAGVVYY